MIISKNGFYSPMKTFKSYLISVMLRVPENICINKPPIYLFFPDYYSPEYICLNCINVCNYLFILILRYQRYRCVYKIYMTGHF